MRERVAVDDRAAVGLFEITRRVSCVACSARRSVRSWRRTERQIRRTRTRTGSLADPARTRRCVPVRHVVDVGIANRLHLPNHSLVNLRLESAPPRPLPARSDWTAATRPCGHLRRSSTGSLAHEAIDLALAQRPESNRQTLEATITCRCGCARPGPSNTSSSSLHEGARSVANFRPSKVLIAPDDRRMRAAAERPPLQRIHDPICRRPPAAE